MIRYVLKFSRWGVVTTSPNLQAGGPSLVGCLQLLIQYIRSNPPYLQAVPPSATWGRAMPWWQGPTDHGAMSWWQGPTGHGAMPLWQWPTDNGAMSWWQGPTYHGAMPWWQGPTYHGAMPWWQGPTDNGAMPWWPYHGAMPRWQWLTTVLCRGDSDPLITLSSYSYRQ
jgi:hypothetical protein